MRHLSFEQHWQNNILHFSTFIDWLPLLVGMIALAASLYIASYNFKKEKYFYKQKIVEEIVHTLFNINLHLDNLILQTKGFLEAKKQNLPLERDENFLSYQYLNEKNSLILKSTTLVQLYFPKIHEQWDIIQDVIDINSNYFRKLQNDFENMNTIEVEEIIKKMNDQFSRLDEVTAFKITKSLQTELKKQEPKIFFF